MQEKLETLEKSETELTELRKLKALYESEKKASYDKRLSSWQEKAKIFSIDKTDKRFDKIEKVKSKFIFPADEKTVLTEEQLALNENTYALLQETGYFELASTDPKGLPNPANPNPTDNMSSGQALLNRMKN